MVLWRNGFEIGDQGISRDQNRLYGTQEAFGKASFPPTNFKKNDSPTFPYLGRLGEGPLGSPVFPLDGSLLALGGAVYPSLDL